MAVIDLDDYEIANLRSLIEAAGYPNNKRPPHNPLYVANTGDWLGQVYLKLPEVDTQPNKTAQELAEAAKHYR